MKLKLFFIALLFCTACQPKSDNLFYRVFGRAVPAGNVMLEENFDSGGTTSLLELTVNQPSHYAPTTTEQPISVAPGNPATDKSAHYVALEGTDEHAPITLGVNLIELFGQDPEELVLEHDSYFVAGYPWAVSSQKFVRCGYSGGGRMSFELIIPWENTAVNMDFFDLAHNKQYTTSTNSPHPEGQKVRWSWWVKLNTPGQSNGFMRLYKNGVEVASVVNAPLRGNTIENFDFCWIGGNYSNKGIGLPSTGHRFMDNVRICRTYPCVEGGLPVPTPVPTAVPTAGPTPRPTTVATPAPTARPTVRPTATPKPKCTCTCKVI